MKPRAGSKIYKGIEIPATSKIYLSKLNREFYISGNTMTVFEIRFIDTGKILKISFENLKKNSNFV